MIEMTATGNRRADRQADLEHEVERRRAEDDAEDRADDERQRRQLAQIGCGGDVRLERQRTAGTSGCAADDVGVLLFSNAHSVSCAGGSEAASCRVRHASGGPF